MHAKCAQSRRAGPVIGIGLAAVVLMAAACQPAKQPPYAEVAVLTGSAYERGYQHGRRFAAKIDSLYEMLIETSLVPFLNREQNDVMAFLTHYQSEEYQDGRFSYQMMLESGKNLLEGLRETHPEVIEELRGLADGVGVEGTGLTFDDILVLNTFVDTMLSFRSVTAFIKQLQSPKMVDFEVLADLSSDGVDNNGDGQVDEPDDNVVKTLDPDDGFVVGYRPRTRAALVEIPPGTAIRFTLWDPPPLSSFEDPDAPPKPGAAQGMDLESVRIRVNDTLYTTECDCIQTALWGDADRDLDPEYGMEVVFTPPGGLPAAAEVALYIQATNVSQITNPPPVHPRMLRDERVTLTTSGFGRSVAEVINRGLADEGTEPPAIAFAVRDDASPDGQVRLAQHFALLDSNITHKHTVLLIHRPDDGHAFAQLGWTGVIWGFSGMNDQGLTYSVMPSDSLDNPFAGQVRTGGWTARLLADGVPVGIKGRELLEGCDSVEEAEAMLRSEGNTFGYNFLLADSQGDLRAVEVDANVFDTPDGGVLTYGPDRTDPGNLDAYGRPLGSVRDDDLRITAMFAKNVPDIDGLILVFYAQPQALWSTFYYRALKAHTVLGEQIEARYGQLDVPGMIEVLRTPDLVDDKESMNAAVYEPEALKLHWAMGQVPATDGEFTELDLGALLEGGLEP